MKPPPATPRIRFRWVRTGDAALFYALDADDEVLAFIDRRAPSRQEQARQVAQDLQDYQRWPGYGRVVAEAIDGDFLGWFSLRVADDAPRRPELGYRLHRRA